MKKRKAKKLKKKVRRKKAKKRKVVFLVIDGLADLPIDKKTPLSEAKKPNLDYLAKNGIVGELNLVPKNLPVASHVANVALLGYDPKKYYLKRGPLEAVGANLPYKEGTLALRCNFATVDKDLRVIDRRAGRNTFGLGELARYINENVKIGADFVLIRTFGHRAVLVINMDLSDEISDSDPHVIGKKVREVSALTKDALVSAKIVQDFLDKTHELIEYHTVNSKRIDQGLLPANYVITRDAGNRLIDLLPHFTERYKVKAVCIAENGVMKATCMLAGFNALTVTEAGFEESLDFIFDNIDNMLPEYDFVYAHIKGPDEPAHDGDFKRKQWMIEKIDERLEVFRNFRGIFVLTCDHITSCEQKGHVYGKVPVLVFGKKKDRVRTFDESTVKKGKLGVIDGKKLWKFVFNR